MNKIIYFGYNRVTQKFLCKGAYTKDAELEKADMWKNIGGVKNAIWNKVHIGPKPDNYMIHTHPKESQKRIDKYREYDIIKVDLGSIIYNLIGELNVEGSRIPTN